MLQIVDAQWKDHLYSLDHLKEGIGLRGYGQRDPLVEYKKESFALFQAMKERVDEEIVRYLWWLRPVRRARRRRCRVRRPPPGASPLILNDPGGRGGRRRSAAPRQQRRSRVRSARRADAAAGACRRRRCRGRRRCGATSRRSAATIPCPCGSGKKYKKCHGAAA